MLIINGVPTLPDSPSAEVMAEIDDILLHLHSNQKVYPSLADGVTLTTGVGAWVLGNYTEIVPANAITSAFDIHYLNVGSASKSDVYEVVLYKGLLGAEIEIGRVRVVRTTDQVGTPPMPLTTGHIDANTRISARLASKSDDGNTMTVCVFYHTD